MPFDRRSDAMSRLRSMLPRSTLPWAALALAALLGGCVAYPAYPGYPVYGYGYGAAPVYYGGYYGGHYGYGYGYGGGWRR
jgi:hypothetical protein